MRFQFLVLITLLFLSSCTKVGKRSTSVRSYNDGCKEQISLNTHMSILKYQIEAEKNFEKKEKLKEEMKNFKKVYSEKASRCGEKGAPTFNNSASTFKKRD